MTIVVTVESCKKERGGNVLIFWIPTPLSTQALNILARLHFLKVVVVVVPEACRQAIECRYLAATMKTV
jgi:hypothetical protein